MIPKDKKLNQYILYQFAPEGITRLSVDGSIVIAEIYLHYPHQEYPTSMEGD